MKTLIIVDVQNDFCPGGALAVSEGDQVVPVINDIQPKFDLVVATQDWHPLDHLSFAANHPNRSVGEVIELNGRPQVLWPTHCVQSTLGAALRSDLDTSRIARVFRKGEERAVDSYSGFFDNDGVHETGLRDFLQQNGVSSVFVCGLATDYCVKFTALDSVKLGFPTYLLLEACRGVDLQAGDVERAIEEMRVAGVEVVSGAEL